MTTLNLPLGVGLLSAAQHQDYLSAAFAANRKCRIVAVGEEPGVPDDLRDRARRLAEHYAVPFVENVDLLLARPDIAVVSIGSEITRHARLALRAIRAGKHVHVDKPMAATVTECRELARAAREAEKRGAKVVSFSRALAPAVQRAKAAIDRGAIGVPRAVRAEFVVTYGPGEDFDPLRDERRFHPRWTGGGELILHGVYPLTCVRYLLDQEFSAVQCFAGALFNRYSRAFDTDDFATLVLRTTSNVIVQVAIGRTHAPAHPSQADIGVRVVGTKGWVAADEQKPTLTWCGRSMVGPRESPFDRDSVQELIDHFVWCICNDQPLIQTIADSAHVLEVVFSAEESARSGQVIALSGGCR